MQRINSFLKSGYFMAIKVFVIVFMIIFIFNYFSVESTNGQGEILRNAIAESFGETYLQTSFTIFLPFLLIGAIFQGEGPLNPLGYFVSISMFVLFLGAIIEYIKKERNKKEYKKIESRNWIVLCFDVLFLIAFSIIVVFPFLVIMDFF